MVLGTLVGAFLVVVDYFDLGKYLLNEESYAPLWLKGILAFAAPAVLAAALVDRVISRVHLPVLALALVFKPAGQDIALVGSHSLLSLRDFILICLRRS
ncbi:hypothetical protein LCL61_29330 [Amycolatopsis coloradensis]|uniref:Uncharacterized protein n=1 Tax=Amycolatopsis coloradensis TaxID=76021 RepID=A0ACD5BJN0_9PSEU